jgi:mRNA-degrading endonuclease RelE of RelBE toxin-antitoxin system
MAQIVCAPREILPAPAFQRDFKALGTLHRDLCQLLISKLTDEVGPEPRSGRAIAGWANRVRKIRIADKCHNIGESKGFRLIYDWEPSTRRLWLLRLYTHAQIRDDIADKEIRRIRKEAGIA